MSMTSTQLMAQGALVMLADFQHEISDSQHFRALDNLETNSELAQKPRSICDHCMFTRRHTFRVPSCANSALLQGCTVSRVAVAIFVLKTATSASATDVLPNKGKSGSGTSGNRN